MGYIVIPIPIIPRKQDIEIQVTINNEVQSPHSKVKLFYWDDCLNLTGYRADCISEMLAKHDPSWMVYYIGAPTDKFVPITFVDRQSKELINIKNS